jgi:hypothetical protein
MVLTKSELITSLQKEVRILLHLATKVDRAQLDYRPTPKQRSTIELLRYLSFMGPTLITAAKAGAFDPSAWTTALATADGQDFDKLVDSINASAEAFNTLLEDVSDADMRQSIEFFGVKQTRGSFFVNVVLCGYAAYRTQLFLYLKACGRTELVTANLWAGVDPQPA